MNLLVQLSTEIRTLRVQIIVRALMKYHQREMTTLLRGWSTLRYLTVLSTLPHYIAIQPIAQYQTRDHIYVSIILISTTSSVFYHIYNESNIIITYLDYSMAFIWCLYDIIAGFYAKKLSIIIPLNAIVFFINISIKYNHNYILLHSIWHCISACKCYYISKLLITDQNIKTSKKISIHII